ncbi:BA14K family protein [Kumtagia ephedrae]
MVSVPPPPQDSAGIDGITTSSVAARAPARPDCNVVACARAYRSFTPSDCTFQPFDGPRRLCRK